MSPSGQEGQLREVYIQLCLVFDPLIVLYIIVTAFLLLRATAAMMVSDFQRIATKFYDIQLMTLS